jgi:hypothetical protein
MLNEVFGKLSVSFISIVTASYLLKSYYYITKKAFPVSGSQSKSGFSREREIAVRSRDRYRVMPLSFSPCAGVSPAELLKCGADGPHICLAPHWLPGASELLPAQSSRLPSRSIKCSISTIGSGFAFLFRRKREAEVDVKSKG